MRHIRIGLAAALLLVGVAGTAAAQYYGAAGLECFRLRAPRARWLANEHARQPFVLELAPPETELDRGCRLVPEKNPVPKELCVPAVRTPSLPPYGRSVYYESLLCYEARCDAADADDAPQIAGEFGGGHPIVKRRDRKRRVCVPAAECHDVCVEGLPLAPACGECAAQVCETDPTCCQYGWYDACVQRAAELCGTCPGVPSPSPTPLRTPAPTPSSSPEPGAACSTAIATVSVSYDQRLFPDVAGVVVYTAYSRARLELPGTGFDSTVVARIVGLTGVTGGVFSAADADYDDPPRANVGLISIPAPIPAGPFVRITFDCVGADGPVPADLSCTVDASTVNGIDVPASCSIALITTPPVGSAGTAFLAPARGLFD